MRPQRFVIAALMALSTLVCLCPSLQAKTFVYFGTYTLGGSSSEGIYVSEFDESTGSIGEPKLAAAAINPSFVAVSPSGDHLYAASEAWGGDADTIGLISYRIKEDGTLEKLNAVPSGGLGACHVAVSPNGKYVGVANYTGGSSAAFAINSDGSLGERTAFFQHKGSSVNPNRQEGPHAHSINFSANGDQAFVADLGIDKILVLDVDPETGKMRPANPYALKTPAGGGPRHFCLHPVGLYALTNLELTSEVALLKYSTNQGELFLGEVISTLPQGASSQGNTTAECLFHPNGKFAYVSNRGHDSIAVIKLDASVPSISLVDNVSSGGETPRGFGIAPSGDFLVVANQKTGNVISMKIDQDTGLLTSTGSEIKIGSPVNVRFVKR
ncbi:lactonase family protein [Stieleria sp. JC731]|uniref:lactonase family protein n=1 Tax=Pirellulaceae TaxID=2691357 RepID=UPI001E28ED39|nr:lactonase family protein [Stieleria sp. JC731]MCC9601367.1 lactonase family protein [Stieleria sp. JC731]